MLQVTFFCQIGEVIIFVSGEKSKEASNPPEKPLQTDSDDGDVIRVF